jgi:hypothetical protein
VAIDHRVGNETSSLTTRIAVQVDGVALSASGAHVTAGPLTYPVGLISSIRPSFPTT